MFYEWRPYVRVADRRKKAAAHAKKLAKRGRVVKPVEIEGRTIASSFWGKAWCDNLESYSDYENRMPRGRTYVRNGSVVDLQVTAGRVQAIVSGSDVYEIDIAIAPLEKRLWSALRRECAGKIGSLVELLHGRFSKEVMQILARPKRGLFPSPKEISLSCSCPDWATMCKHVAAALYGVGARLDREPELFFTLRQVDQTDLVSAAASARSLGSRTRANDKSLGDGDLGALFGIDIDQAPEKKCRPPAPAKLQPAVPRRPAAMKPESGSAPAPSRRRRRPVRCYYPGCRNPAAPRFGMFCAAVHKRLPQDEKDIYRRLVRLR